MDTENTPLWASLDTVKGQDGNPIYLVVTDKGQFTVELLRQAQKSYKLLSRNNKRVVKRLIREANEAGVALNE